MDISVEVRTAHAGDLDALLGLYVQLSPSNDGTDRTAASGALGRILEAPGVSLFVALLGGVVAGTATLVVVPNLTHQAQPWAQLENMVVDQRHRGFGVGARLLQHCLDHAWATGCYKVQLQSDNARVGAHAFYEREGFTASSRGYRRYRIDA